MLAGLALFYVGAVLWGNGLWVLGRIGDKEMAVIDVFVGGIALLVTLNLAFGSGADLASVKGCAFFLLFTFTYFWVALNQYNGADGRGWAGSACLSPSPAFRSAFRHWQAQQRSGATGSAYVGLLGGSCR